MTTTIKTKPERMKTEILHMQRWEDEGGHMVIENNTPTPHRLLIPPVPISSAGHNTSLQWNEKFVIEPFKPGNGFFLPRKKA